jgi:hypothetical protein
MAPKWPLASFPSVRHCCSHNDCLDIGTDLGSPVSVDYYDQAPFKFNGKIDKVHVKYKK